MYKTELTTVQRYPNAAAAQDVTQLRKDTLTATHSSPKMDTVSVQTPVGHVACSNSGFENINQMTMTGGNGELSNVPRNTF